MSTIGTRLKESREKKGLLQAELAKMIGVKSAGVISNWEQDVSKPKADKMIEICQVLGISLSYLLDYYGEEKAPPYSDEAMKLAEDYDGLDRHGKRLVRLVADEEKARCEVERQAKAAALRESREQMETAKELEAPEETVYILPYYLHPSSAGTGEYSGGDEWEELTLRKRPPRGASYVVQVHGDSMEPTYRDGDKVFVRAGADIRLGQIGIFIMGGEQYVKELGDGVLISHNSEYDPRPMTADIQCQGLVLGVCDKSYFE